MNSFGSLLISIWGKTNRRRCWRLKGSRSSCRELGSLKGNGPLLEVQRWPVDGICVADYNPTRVSEVGFGALIRLRLPQDSGKEGALY
jgi:hypothetical protein